MDYIINIYLANLSEFNSGNDVGEWIELPTVDLEEQIQEILGDDEEYIILDAECDFLEVDEYENIYNLNELALSISNLRSYERRVLKSILFIESDIYKALNILKEQRYVLYEDVCDDDDLGQYLLDNDYYNVDDSIRSYIDTESLGRDFAINHNMLYTKENTAIEVF